MTVGERIQKLRKQKGYSQEKLAEYLSVSRQAISKWEKNVCEPNIECLTRMSKLFDVNLDYLLTGEVINEEDKKTNTTEKHNTGSLFSDKKDILLLITILFSLCTFVGLFIYALLNPLYVNQQTSFIFWYIQIFQSSGTWFRILVFLSVFINIFSLVVFLKRGKKK